MISTESIIKANDRLIKNGLNGKILVGEKEITIQEINSAYAKALEKHYERNKT